MKGESEKQCSSKQTHINLVQIHYQPEEINQLKKSTDSLYHQLQSTPNDERKTKNHEQNQSSQLKQKQVPTTSQNDHKSYKVNLASKFQNSINHTEEQKISDKKIIGPSQKLNKPSTPTFNTKSSLNFLKHRKQQIILNQTLGLTLNNLQQIRKSKSKSRQKSQKSQILPCKKSSLQNHKNICIDEEIEQLKQLKKNSNKSKVNIIKNVRSFSDLQRVEAILNGSFEKVNSGFSNEKLGKNEDFHNRSQSVINMNNSLRSSRSQSIQYDIQNKSNLSRLRSTLLNQINEKLTQSKLLRNFAIEQQGRKKNRKKQKQANLFKRLNNLEMILLQLERKSQNKCKKKTQQIKQSKQEIKTFEVIGTLRDEINYLNKQINLMPDYRPVLIKTLRQRQTINQVNHNQRINNSNVNNKTNQNHQYRNTQIKTIGKEKQKGNFLNHMITSSQNNLSKQKFHTDRSINKQVPIKVTFQYSNNYNNIMQPKILSYHQNQTIPITFNQRLPYQRIKNLPFSINNLHNSNNSFQHQISYRNNSCTKPQQIIQNFQPYSLNQLLNQQAKVNQFPNNYPNHYGTTSNKSLTLKNKHAIQVKNYSPLKNTTFNSSLIQKNNNVHYYRPY